MYLLCVSGAKWMKRACVEGNETGVQQFEVSPSDFRARTLATERCLMGRTPCPSLVRRRNLVRSAGTPADTAALEPFLFVRFRERRSRSPSRPHPPVYDPPRRRSVAGRRGCQSQPAPHQGEGPGGAHLRPGEHLRQL